jgi:hypothetical protein
MENSKIVDLLNELNLKKTAEAFKNEIGKTNISNDYKQVLLNQILEQLKSSTSNASIKEKEEKKVNEAKVKEKASNLNKVLLPLEKNKLIMDGLISKISSKFESSNFTGIFPGTQSKNTTGEGKLKGLEETALRLKRSTRKLKKTIDFHK